MEKAHRTPICGEDQNRQDVWNSKKVRHSALEERNQGTKEPRKEKGRKSITWLVSEVHMLLGIISYHSAKVSFCRGDNDQRHSQCMS